MRTWLRLGCCATAVLLIFVGIFHHEAWRDEADVWLVARDRDVAELLRLTRYMGHPSLWYLLVMPLAKAGLPYLSMFILHGSLISLAIAFLVWKSPFPDPFKLAIPFGYYFLFEYALVARTYAVSILLLFLIAWVFQERESKSKLYGLLVLLLMSTNAYALLIGMSLAALTSWELWVERRRALLPAWVLMGLGFLAAYLQLRPPADGQITDVCCVGSWWNLDLALTDAFLPVHGREIPWAWGLGGALLLVSFAWFWSSPRVFLLGVMSYALLGYFYVCKYGDASRHFGFVLVLLIFLTWLRLGSRREPRLAEHCRKLAWGLWSLSLVASAIAGLEVWRDEVRNAFSTSKPMAEFIERHVPPGAVIAAHPHVYAESVLAYLGDRSQFYYPSRKAMGSHMSWDLRYAREISMSEFQALHALFTELHDDERDVYLLTNDTIQRSELEQVATMEGLERMAIGRADEVFRLYRWRRPPG